MVSITSSSASWISAPAEGEDIGTHREVVTGAHLASAAAPCLDLESEVGVAVTSSNPELAVELFDALVDGPHRRGQNRRPRDNALLHRLDLPLRLCSRAL